MALLSLLTLGFFLGMRHATDSDHVAAVSTIVSRERTVRAASVIGVFWGIGHTLTILIVGGAIVGFEVVISTRTGLTFEFLVALMLIVLGGLNIVGFRRGLKILAAGSHSHDGLPAHAHGARSHHYALRAPSIPASEPKSKTYGAIRSFVVGTLHGLAGSAAVALLVLGTVRDPRWALLYLLLFGVGTIAGMVLVTSAMAVPLALASKRSTQWAARIRTATGVVSVAMGVFLAYRIGFVDGLGASWR